MNGSYGEGGGALLRSCLVMSVLTQQPLRLHNIRGAMRRTGLNHEDFTFIGALAEICQAKTAELKLGSTELTFEPRRPPQRLRDTLDIQAHDKGQSPGSAVILAEALLPVLARCGSLSRATIYGETHNAGVLNYDAFERATLSAHRHQGICAFPTLVSGGFGYAARGSLTLEVEPSVFEPLNWEKRGDLVAMNAFVTYCGWPDEAAAAVAEDARRQLGVSKDQLEVELVAVQAKEPGLCLTLSAEHERGIGSSSAAAGRGVKIEAVAEIAARGLKEWLDTEATVDPYLADQILLPSAFAEGRTCFTTSQITRRLTTMAWVVKQFLPIKITILGREGEPGSVVVER